MAVENQTPPAQPAAPSVATSPDFVRVISAAAALAAVIIAGMALVVSITVAPIREDMRLLREDMRLLRTDVQRGFEGTNSEFKAIRKDIAVLSERLTRVETLLEQGAAQTLTPEEPATEAE